MIFVIFLLFLIGISNGAQNLCRFPQRWKNTKKETHFHFLNSNYDFDYKKRPNEWVTLNSKTDYYKLVLSWSPTFCKQLPSSHRNRTFQCQYEDFGLVVHGFWAQSKTAKTPRQHPRNCRNSEQLPLIMIKRHFCMMPDESLIQAEWEKHGTCSFRTAEEYLTTIEKLFTGLTIPDMKAVLRDKNIDHFKVKKVFLTANRSLRPNQIYVYMKDKDLVDIKICYDLKLNFTACPRS